MALKPKKQIYDNVHGYIGLTELELEAIDTPVFQRLRNIKQLGPADMVYPGATHTRFAHSLGTMYLMDLFLRNAMKKEVGDDEIQKLRLAALLHDVGHYPYSHSLEYVITEKFRGKDHVQNGTEIIKRFIKEKLRNYSAEEITKIISGKEKGEFGMLLSSALDADKSDYMLRDSYNTGVPYGKVAISSLLRILTFEEDKIIFEKDESPIENFLIGRYHLYRTVFHHKTVVGFNLMLQRIYEFLVDERYLLHPGKLLEKEGNITGYTDAAVLSAMQSYTEKGKKRQNKELVNMFLNRTPLELAYANTESSDRKKPQANELIVSLEQDQGLREELAKKAGIEPEWIFPTNLRTLGIIDDEANIYIRRKEGLVPLTKGNALILNMIGSKVLHDSRLYTKHGYGIKVREAFEKMLKR